METRTLTLQIDAVKSIEDAERALSKFDKSLQDTLGKPYDIDVDTTSIEKAFFGLEKPEIEASIVLDNQNVTSQVEKLRPAQVKANVVLEDLGSEIDELRNRLESVPIEPDLSVDTQFIADLEADLKKALELQQVAFGIEIDQKELDETVNKLARFQELDNRISLVMDVEDISLDEALSKFSEADNKVLKSVVETDIKQVLAALMVGADLEEIFEKNIQGKIELEQAELDAAIRKAKEFDESFEPTIELDITKLQGPLNEAARQLGTLDDTKIDLDVDANVSEATVKLQRLDDTLDKNIDLEVNVDAATATSKLQKLDAVSDDLRDTLVKPIPINVDTSKATSKVSTFFSKFRSQSSSIGNNITQSLNKVKGSSLGRKIGKTVGKGFGLGVGVSIFRAISSNPDVQKAIEPITKVLQGALSEVATAIAPALEQVAGFLTKIFDQIDLEAIGKILGDVITTLLAALEPLIPVVADIVTAIGTFIETLFSDPEFVAYLTLLGEAFAEIGIALLPLIPPLTELFLALLKPALAIVSSLIPVIVVFAEILGALAPVIKLVADVLNFLSPVIKLLAPLLLLLLGPLGAIAAAFLIIKKAVDFLRPVFERIAGVVEFLADKFSFLGEIGKILSGDFSNLKEKFTKVWKGIREAFLKYSIVGALIRQWDNVKGFLSRTWDSVKNKFSNVWKNIKAIWLKYTPVGQIIQNWDKITGFLSNTWDKIKTRVSNAWKEIKDAILQPIRDARDKLSGIVDSIGNKLSNIPGIGRFFNGAAIGAVMTGAVPAYAYGGVDTKSVGRGLITKKPTYITSELHHTEAILPEAASIQRIESILGRTNILDRLYLSFGKKLANANGTTNNVDKSSVVRIEPQVIINNPDLGKSQGSQRLAARQIGVKVANEVFKKSRY